MDLSRALQLYRSALQTTIPHSFLVSKDGRIFSPQPNQWAAFFSRVEAKKQFQSRKNSKSETWWISKSSDLTSSGRIAEAIVFHENFYQNDLFPVQICSLFIRSKDKSAMFQAILRICPASFLLTWKFNLEVKDKAQFIELVHCDYFSDKGTTIKIIQQLNISQLFKTFIAEVLSVQFLKISQRYSKLQNKQLQNAFWTSFSCADSKKSRKLKFQKPLYYFKEFKSMNQLIRNLEYDQIHNWKSKFQSKRQHITNKLGFRHNRAPALALFASFQIGKLYGSQERVEDVLDSLKRSNSSRTLNQTKSTIALNKSQKSSLKYINKLGAQRSQIRTLALELTKEKKMFDFSRENFDIFKKAFESQTVQKCDLQLKQPKIRVKQES